jgi:hypothetical protein
METHEMPVELSPEELLSESANELPERSLMRHRRRHGGISQSNVASNTIAQSGLINVATIVNVQPNIAIEL